MNPIEKRVEKLEEQMGINQKAETLDEMIEKYFSGGYGNGVPVNMMALVVELKNAEKEGRLDKALAGFDNLPAPLSKYLKETFNRAFEIRKSEKIERCDHD